MDFRRTSHVTLPWVLALRWVGDAVCFNHPRCHQWVISSSHPNWPASVSASSHFQWIFSVDFSTGMTVLISFAVRGLSSPAPQFEKPAGRWYRKTCREIFYIRLLSICNRLDQCITSFCIWETLRLGWSQLAQKLAASGWVILLMPKAPKAHVPSPFNSYLPKHISLWNSSFTSWRNKSRRWVITTLFTTVNLLTI